jgi:hypothetical protein
VVGMVLIVIGVYVAQMDRARTTPVPSTVGGRSQRPSRGRRPPLLWWSVFDSGGVRVGPSARSHPTRLEETSPSSASWSGRRGLLAFGSRCSFEVARRRWPRPGGSIAWKAVAGILVGSPRGRAGTRLAHDRRVVLSLALLSVPTVLPSLRSWRAALSGSPCRS